MNSKKGLDQASNVFNPIIIWSFLRLRRESIKRKECLENEEKIMIDIKNRHKYLHGGFAIPCHMIKMN